MEKIQTFEQFWPFYLSQHQSAVNRYLHLFGLIMALPVLYFAFSADKLWLLALPICGYGFAWVGHFIIEHNRPATFTYPVWSFMADFKMCYYILTGKLEQELRSLKGYCDEQVSS